MVSMEHIQAAADSQHELLDMMIRDRLASLHMHESELTVYCYWVYDFDGWWADLSGNTKLELIAELDRRIGLRQTERLGAAA